MTTSKLPAASTLYTKWILFAREEQIVELKHCKGNGDIKHLSETNDYTSEIIKIARNSVKPIPKDTEHVQKDAEHVQKDAQYDQKDVQHV